MRKAAFLLPFFSLCACSMKTLALRSTTDLLDRGASALYEEQDPQLARESMGAQLKMLEVLLRNEPRNQKLLKLAAEGFNGYAFLFLEDSQPERAKGFYLRGKDLALRALARRTTFSTLTELDFQSLEKVLKTAQPKDAPALFWAAFGWAGWINLSRDSASALADLPKAVLLMQRVSELSPDFHFAGPEIFFGVYYASRPAILGGDIKKAKDYFQQARQRTGGRYLMSYVLEARYYAVGAQDKELFKSLLGKVRDSPAGTMPDALLSDQVAKEKAASLLQKADDYF